MEKSAIDLICKKVTIRMNDFKTRINQLIINENLGLSLYEVEQLLNIKVTSPTPLHKLAPKYIPFYREVGRVYCILEIYKYILPDYNEMWLLYGNGNMLASDTNNTEVNDFVTRFEKFKNYTTENVTFLEDLVELNLEYCLEGEKVKYYLKDNIITNFANVFAGLNKLKNKLKLKDLNIAWLLSNEGDMFEKTEN